MEAEDAPGGLAVPLAGGLSVSGGSSSSVIPVNEEDAPGGLAVPFAGGLSASGDSFTPMIPVHDDIPLREIEYEVEGMLAQRSTSNTAIARVISQNNGTIISPAALPSTTRVGPVYATAEDMRLALCRGLEVTVHEMSCTPKEMDELVSVLRCVPQFANIQGFVVDQRLVGTCVCGAAGATQCSNTIEVTERLGQRLGEFVYGTKFNMPLSERLQCALQIGRCLNWLHSCKPVVVHGDVSLDNVFVLNGTLRVGGFGCCAFVDDSEAKERKLRDVRQFGEVLYELITRKRRGDGWRAVLDDTACSDSAKELVEKCLHDEDISLGDIVDEIGDLEIAIEEESEAEFVEIIRKEVHDQKTTSFWTQHFPEKLRVPTDEFLRRLFVVFDHGDYDEAAQLVSRAMFSLSMSTDGGDGGFATTANKVYRSGGPEDDESVAAYVHLRGLFDDNGFVTPRRFSSISQLLCGNGCSFSKGEEAEALSFKIYELCTARGFCYYFSRMQAQAVLTHSGMYLVRLGSQGRLWISVNDDGVIKHHLVVGTDRGYALAEGGAGKYSQIEKMIKRYRKSLNLEDPFQ